MVSYSILLVAAVAAYFVGLLVGRSRGQNKVVWESAVARDPSHDVAVADPEFQAYLAQGQLIAAIKRYRTLTGLGLKESKDAVDALQRARVAKG